MAAKTFNEWWDSFPREHGTFSCECAKEGWNAAIKLVVENGNSLQQLKAEIAAAVDVFQGDGIWMKDSDIINAFCAKLRQLSAV